MVGWHHRLNGHEFEQALGDGEGQGSLVCCSPWGHKDLDTTERLNNSIFNDPLLLPFLSLGKFRKSNFFYRTPTSSDQPQLPEWSQQGAMAGGGVSPHVPVGPIHAEPARGSSGGRKSPPQGKAALGPCGRLSGARLTLVGLPGGQEATGGPAVGLALQPDTWAPASTTPLSSPEAAGLCGSQELGLLFSH